MTERQSVSGQPEPEERSPSDGVLAASDDLAALAEQYSRLSIEEVLSPGERRRLNDVAEAVRRSVEEDTDGAVLPMQAAPREGLLSPAVGEAIPLPPHTG